MKRQLLNWVKKQIKPFENVKVENFSTSFKDGMVLLALVHSIDPFIFDFSQHSADDPKKKVEFVLTVAEKQFFIQPLLEIDDVVTEIPDEMLVMSYILEFFQKFGTNIEDLVVKDYENVLEEKRKIADSSCKKIFDDIETTKKGVESKISKFVETLNDEDAIASKKVSEFGKEKIEDLKIPKLSDEYKKEVASADLKIKEFLKTIEDEEKKFRIIEEKPEVDRSKSEVIKKFEKEYELNSDNVSKQIEEFNSLSEKEVEKSSSSVSNYLDLEKKADLEFLQKLEKSDDDKADNSVCKKYLDQIDEDREEVEKKLGSYGKKYSEAMSSSTKIADKYLEDIKTFEKSIDSEILEEKEDDLFTKNILPQLEEFEKLYGKKFEFKSESENIEVVDNYLSSLFTKEEEEDKAFKKFMISLGCEKLKIEKKFENYEKSFYSNFEDPKFESKMLKNYFEEKEKVDELFKDSKNILEETEGEEEEEEELIKEMPAIEASEKIKEKKMEETKIDEVIEEMSNSEFEEKEKDCYVRIKETLDEEDMYWRGRHSDRNYGFIDISHHFSMNDDRILPILEKYISEVKDKDKDDSSNPCFGEGCVKVADILLKRKNEFSKALGILKNNAKYSKIVCLKLTNIYLKHYNEKMENANSEIEKLFSLSNVEKKVRKKYGKAWKSEKQNFEKFYNEFQQSGELLELKVSDETTKIIDNLLISKSNYLMKAMEYGQIAEKKIDLKNEDFLNLVDSKILINLAKVYDELNIFEKSHYLWEILLKKLEKTYTRRSSYFISFYTKSYIKSLKKSKIKNYGEQLQSLFKNSFVCHTSEIYGELANYFLTEHPNRNPKKHKKEIENYKKQNEFYKYVPHYCFSLDYTDEDFLIYKKLKNTRKVSVSFLKNCITQISLKNRELKRKTMEKEKFEKQEKKTIEFLMSYLDYCSRDESSSSDRKIMRNYSLLFNYFALRMTILLDYHCCYILFCLLKTIKDPVVIRNIIAILIMAGKNDVFIRRKLLWYVLKTLRNDNSQLYLNRALIEIADNSSLFYLKIGIMESENKFLKYQLAQILPLFVTKNNDSNHFFRFKSGEEEEVVKKEITDIFKKILSENSLNDEKDVKLIAYCYIGLYVLYRDDEYLKKLKKLFDEVGNDKKSSNGMDIFLKDEDFILYLVSSVPEIFKNKDLHKGIIKIAKKKKLGNAIMDVKFFYAKSADVGRY